MKIKTLVNKILDFGEKINKIKLRPYQRKRGGQLVEAVILHEPGIFTTLWSRKCLTGDSLIWMADGKCIPISQIKKGDCILSINQNDFIEEDEVEEIWRTGKKEVVKVSTNYGLTLSTSDDHLYYSPQGWREAKKLVPLQKFKKDRKFQIQKSSVPRSKILDEAAFFWRHQGRVGAICSGFFGKETLGKDVVALLGYLISDGYYGKGQTVKFTNLNKKLLLEAASFAKIFDLKAKWYPKGRSFDILFSSESKASELSPNRLINFLRGLGIHGQTKKEKVIPDKIFTLIPDEVSFFINRLFAGDGNAYPGKLNEARPSFSCVASSLIMARQLQLLLFRFDIHSFIKPQGNVYIVYTSDSQSVINFYEKIGPIFGKEDQSYLVYKAAFSLKRKFHYRYSFDSDIEWPSIRRIDKSGLKEKMWDLRTKKNHNFIANGLVVHNSGKSEKLKVVMLALMTLLPELARTHLKKDFPRLKLFEDGLEVAFAGPKESIAKIPFIRLRRQARQKKFVDALHSLELEVVASNTLQFELSNGSTATAFSGSETAANEGPGAHILLIDEAALLSPFSLYKILHPMVAHVNGLISQTGTPGRKRCPFLTAIEYNKRKFPHLHHEVPYTGVIPYSKDYAAYVEGELDRLPGGATNPFFRMNYLLEWLIAEGHFIDAALFTKLATGTRGKINGGKLVAGVDWGKVTSATTVTILNGGDNFASVVDLFEIKGDWDHQFDYLIPFLQGYKLDAVFSESVGSGDPLTTRLKTALGKSIVHDKFMSAQYKDKIFTNLQTEITGKPSRFEYFDDEKPETKSFIRQFLDVEQEVVGKLLVVKKPKEEGAADDFCFSTALANDALQSGAKVSIAYQTTDKKRDTAAALENY